MFESSRLSFVTLLRILCLLSGLELFVTPVWAQDTPLEIAYAGPSDGSNLAQGIEMVFEAINEEGGIDNRKLVLNYFDDQNNPDQALRQAKKLNKSNNLAVIGHSKSTISYLTGRIYAAQGIPAITPKSTAVKVTQNNDWYFRTVFNDRVPARFGALYVKDVFKADTVSIISDNELFGEFLGNEFKKNAQSLGIQVAYHHIFDYNDPNRIKHFDRIVQELLNLPEQGVIFLGMYSPEAAKLVVRIRESGLQNIILGGDTLAVEPFVQKIRDIAPNQIWTYTRNVYGTSPFLFETAGHLARKFRERYREKYDAEPDWATVYAFDAALVLVEAIRESGIAKAKKLSISQARQKIRDTIASFDSPARAVLGLTGPNYFDDMGDAPKTVAMGSYQGPDFVPASIQFPLIPRPEAVLDLEKKIEQSQIVKIEDLHFFKTDVVYTGIRLKKIKEIDYAHKTFQADILLWFRSQVLIDPDDIQFSNLLKMESFEPLQQENYGLKHYQLFRVLGTFQADDDNPDQLGRFFFNMRFRHARYPRERILFIPDSIGMGIKDPQKLLLELQENQVMPSNQQRIIDSLTAYEESITESALGSIRTAFPTLEYSEYNLNFRLAKTGVSFIFENQWYLLTFYLVLNVFMSTVGVFFILKLFGMLFSKTKTDFDDRLLAILRMPTHILAFLIGLQFVHQSMTELLSPANNETIDEVLEFLILTTFLIGGLYRIGDLCREYFIKWAEKTETELDDIIAPYVGKIIRTICVALVGMKAGQITFGLSATAFLGMLGGFSLAAGLLFKDFFAEIVACFTLYLNNPFKEGDKVSIDGDPKGDVVNIGLRATTIRYNSGQVVQMPNTKVITSTVENFSRAESLKTEYQIRISGISSKMIQHFVVEIRRILNQESGVLPDSGHVSFAGFENNGRVIQINFRSSPNWEETQLVLEQVNVRILKLLEVHQISQMAYEFLYVGQQEDPGPKFVPPFLSSTAKIKPSN